MTDTAEHVAYLGAFVVSGLLWRGDLYRDVDGRYWAEHTVTTPDGQWQNALHHVVANDQEGAIYAALMGALEYFMREGHDVGFMTVVHYAPGVEGMVAQARQESAAPQFLH